MPTKRTLNNTIHEVSKHYPILLLTGPRQVGKTTLLQEAAKDKRNYVTLDDPLDKALAKEDPKSFLERYEPPILIDEVQYAPELFPYLKIAADQAKKPGMFWLTGSQQFGLMQHVSESLAGRIVILELQGFSEKEESGCAEDSIPFIPTETYLKNNAKKATNQTLTSIYTRIWRGSFPFIATHKDSNEWERFYRSYVATYLQRDVRDYTSIHDEDRFLKLLQVAAAHTGQLINYESIASDIGVSSNTIKSWLTILRASGIIYLLRPYFNNQAKRLTKTPKLYFTDTGLCAYLTGWNTPEVLEKGAMAGAFFENHVVMEIIKSYIHNGKTPRLYFYRDKEKHEIDLIIEHNNTLHPIEIKKTANPNKSMLKHFQALEKITSNTGHSGIICLSQKHLPLTETSSIIPVSYI